MKIVRLWAFVLYLFWGKKVLSEKVRAPEPVVVILPEGELREALGILSSWLNQLKSSISYEKSLSLRQSEHDEDDLLLLALVL